MDDSLHSSTSLRWIIITAQVGCDIISRLIIVILRGVALHPPGRINLRILILRNSSPKAGCLRERRVPIPAYIQTSTPSASACSPHHTLLYVILRPFFASNSSHIHVHFDRLPLTLALSPAFLTLLPCAPTSSIAAREPCGTADFLLIPMRQLVACGPTIPCLIPACGRPDDAQRGILRTLPFCARAEAAFARRINATLPPLSSLFASVGVRVPWNEHKSPSSRRISRANLVHLGRLSRAVDGDGEACGWGEECRWRSTHTEMGMLVEMEMAVRRWRWSAGMGCALAPLQVGVGTYPLLLPTHLALAFAPRSDPRPRPAFPLPPLCDMKKRGCGYGYIPSSLSFSASPPCADLSSLNAYGSSSSRRRGWARACTSYPRSHSRSSSCDQGKVSVRTNAGVTIFFLRRYGGCALRILV
ncbi:hypothetical protein B0H13DRAFT_2674501 [Mycena leptocephala]|nr:hypothetical protein B0H13DRAFT_2674501 [Mycena leptocephala]